MGSWRKLLAEMRASANPCTYHYEDCERILLRLGFALAPNSGTSHRKFVLKRAGAETVRIGLLKQGSGPLSRWYVDDMLAALEKHRLFPPDDD